MIFTLHHISLLEDGGEQLGKLVILGGIHITHYTLHIGDLSIGKADLPI